MSRRPATPESSILNMLEGLRREGMLTERSIEFYGEQAKICLKDLQHLQRNLEPWNVTIKDAKSLLDYWTSKELAVSTKRGYLAALRTWTAYYGNHDIERMRVIFPTDTRPNADWLTDEEARRLIALPKAPIDDLIIHCELCLGMRRIELLRLQETDFNISGQFVDIKGKGARGGKPRRMPFHRDTVRILKAYLKDRLQMITGAAKVPAALLVYKQGRTVRPYGDSGIDLHLKKIGSVLGIQFSNHTLRRTFGRLCWLSGVKVETISKMLGHSSIDMTLRYIGVDMDDMNAAMRRFLL